MKGGKLLSEGGFGCVFNPSIKCNGESDSEKFVSKIQRYDNSAKNEIAIRKNTNRNTRIQKSLCSNNIFL